MLHRLKTFIFMLIDLAKPRSVLLAEISVLRRQVITLRRHAPKRLSLCRGDRIFLVLLCHLFPDLKKAIHILRSVTFIRWHRMGFRALWRWKSRPRGGRPRVSTQIRDLIREMNLTNRLRGAPRVHGELMMLGINIVQSTVAKYMTPRRGPPSQSWNTFLRNQADGIASCNFLIVPTIGFKLLYAFIVLGHDRRNLLHVGVTSHPTSEWTARPICEAFPWDSAPDHLIRDNDPIYGHTFKRQLAVMGIRDGPTVLRSPWQKGNVERLIGSIRRECLDHLITHDTDHLQRVLKKICKIL